MIRRPSSGYYYYNSDEDKYIKVVKHKPESIIVDIWLPEI
jgi:hypothetical protein